MPHGRDHRTDEVNLRVGAVVAEIEGLYTALLRTSHPDRRLRLLYDLAGAARRLTALTALPPGWRLPAPRRASRWRRRRLLAARGTAWLLHRVSPRDPSTKPN